MKIEVGDYVRTEIGIFIISHINIDFNDDDINKCLLCQNEKVAFTSIDYIKNLKHSKNIIDLVETGDLIKTNEEKTIIHIYDIDVLEAVKEDIEEGHFTIESIVTHEQFASIEYKVEE